LKSILIFSSVIFFSTQILFEFFTSLSVRAACPVPC